MLNITFKEDTLTGIADVRAQVRANAVKWDVADLGGASCARGAAEGLFEPLDYSVIKTDGIDKAMVHPEWIGVIYYSTVIAWNTDKYGTERAAELGGFLGHQKIPGTRSLSRGASETFEVALMADGVDPAKLYPLDVDRALKSLARSSRTWLRGGHRARKRRSC